MSSSLVSQGSRFVDRVQNLVDVVKYTRALGAEDQRRIFQHRYDAYLREGAIDPNETGLFTDEYDRVENAQIFGLYLGDRLCASMRIHATSRTCKHMPAMWTFADILNPEIAAGKTIVDPSRFVVDYEASREFPELAYVTARLGWIAGEHYNADLILSTARTEHQAFYRRVFNYRLVADCRPYKTLKKPLSLLFLDYQIQKAIVELRYPFLRSSDQERYDTFGELQSSKASRRTVGVGGWEACAGPDW
jgi:hypothetical protein